VGAGAFIPIAAFVLVVGTVGWRLLGLWRRTRQAPELQLGLGLVSMSCVAIPLAGLGRLPGIDRTLFGKLCFASGMGSVAVAAVLLIAFTQSVFRPDASWARGLFAGVSIAVASAVAWMSWANFTGETLSEIVPRMRPGTLTLMGSLLACFAWAACESFLHYAKLKRRLALGLADPVLVDRFFLWGMSSGANTLMIVLLFYCVRTGMVIMREPVALSVMAIFGSVMSAAWYLTFLAPESYLEFVRRRAARA